MDKQSKVLYCKKHGIIIDTNNSGYEWQEKYNDILNFLIEKRRFPRNSGTGDEYELNKYYTAHYALHEEGVMSEKQKSYFEKIDVVGKIIQKEKRVGYLRDILFFILSHKRLPVVGNSSSENSQAERLRRFHTDNKHERLSKFGIKEEYDTLCKYIGYRKKRLFTAVEMAEVFYILYGRFPNFGAESKIERTAFEFCDGFRIFSGEETIQAECNEAYFLIKL